MLAPFTIALCLLATLPALAYERPGATVLRGGWEVCSVPPAVELVKDRAAKPDFPTLAPALEQVVPAGIKPPPSADWKLIDVPSAWEQVLGIDYNGCGWYRRPVEVPEEWAGNSGADGSVRDLAGTAARPTEDSGRGGPPHRRIWIEFDAVSCAAGVWLNGQWLGGHVGDMSRWRVEATKAAKPGANELLVYVDELPGHVTQGFLCVVMPHHGGIWQDLRMYETGPASIEPDGVWVDANPADGTFTAEVKLTDTLEAGGPIAVGFFELDKSGHYTSEIGDAATDLNWTIGGTTITFTGRIPGYKLWNPETPQMYEAYFAVGGDVYANSSNAGARSPDYEKYFSSGRSASADGAARGAFPLDKVTQRFAFRDIRTDGYKLLLNGKPVSFRSALTWGAYPRIVSPAPPPELVREEFAQIKSLGFNAETVCMIIPPDYYYDIADEMGVLLWQEYPTWHATFDSKDRETYVREFRAFMLRDRAHPSIVLRSMSCEAGRAKDNCLAALYHMSKALTGTPSQDNTSWFWLSDPEIADWYDEHNYYTCAQWERYLLHDLPAELDSRPPKPFLIGESIIASTWPDTDALFSAVTTQAVAGKVPTDYDHTPRDPLPDGLTGLDSPSTWEMAPPGGWPYWFPKCFDSVVKYEDKLRLRYNAYLPDDQDIIRDWLMPQSYEYALNFRRFQIELMFSSPRYTGYTINVVRDMPLIRAGFIDDLGRLRWTPEQWAWHTGEIVSPVTAGQDAGGRLYSFDPKLAQDAPAPPHCIALSEGYRDLKPLLADWPDVQWVSGKDFAGVVGPGLTDSPRINPVVVTSVLTNDMVDYIADGGVVLLLASKWPGAFSTVPHMYWRDQPLIPPVGLWKVMEQNGEVPDVYNTILKLQQYDLTRNYSQVVPVKDLGIEDEFDPLLRLLDTHDQTEVWPFDQLTATRCGKGMLMISSLDHSTPAGQWLLGNLVRFCYGWQLLEGIDSVIAQGMLVDGKPVQASAQAEDMSSYPVTSMSPERLKQFAVARANGVMGLDEGWQFKLDPERVGQQQGWMNADYDASGWDTVRAGIGWESLGYDYDGMAWYVRTIDAPADWAGARLRLVADGIDDAYTVWVNGKAVATHGSFTNHDETVWLKQTVTDLTGYINPGQPNTLALQVVDITGQGGIWKPIYITVE